MIDPARIKKLNDKVERADCRYVLYWMQQSQRARFNHALEYAIERANDLDQSVVVGFGLMDDYPEANERHYAFMLKGLAETADELSNRGIKLVMNVGSPPEVMLDLADDASIVVCDRGYLRHQIEWRTAVAEGAECQVVQIESDVVVPVESASDKAEYAARTIRKKINSQKDQFLTALKHTAPRKSSLPLHVKGDLDPRDWRGVLETLNIDRSISQVSRFASGARAARAMLQSFLSSHFDGYAHARNDPANPECSKLSPYLHFGQVSPLEIALACGNQKGVSGDDKEAFLEELIVRRELAINFVYYTPDYDAFSCLPNWARETLTEHKRDAREFIYSLSELRSAETHDPAWNAAMREMIETGYMHNYMRMYWGKKILEWSESPEQGYDNALALNNRFFLDGRDANSYANVAWLFGLHDRPWKEREIFGKVRYMNANGLKRKFDIDAYIEWSRSL